MLLCERERERGERETERELVRAVTTRISIMSFIVTLYYTCMLTKICALPQQYQIKSSDRAYYGLKKYKILRTKK